MDIFGAYETALWTSGAPSDAFRVADAANGNAMSTLGRPINRQADDLGLNAMADEEFLYSWVEGVRTLLCTDEHPIAREFFKKYGIEP